jgi:signal transduction histidine kinase
VLRDNYKLLFEIHHAAGNVEMALRYKLFETSINDSIFATQQEAEVLRIQMKYELSRKEKQIDLLHHDNIIQQKDIDRKIMQRDYLIVGFTVVGLLVLLLFRSNAMVRKRNAILQQHNQEIQEQRDVIIQQKKEVEHLNTQKNRILSIISHDVKSPMNSLSAFLSMMSQQWLSAEESQKMTAMLQAEFDNTQMVLGNLLFWANRELHPGQPIFTTFHVYQCLDDVIKSLGRKAEEKQIAVVNQGDPEGEVVTDHALATIVLRNLISNAIKFSKENSCIYAAGCVRDGLLTIEVRDEGTGIAEEDHDKIFQYDSNFKTLGTRQEKGSGLGLTLCKALVEAIGGQMGFTSKAGVGSTFFFTLPVVQP